MITLIACGITSQKGCSSGSATWQKHVHFGVSKEYIVILSKHKVD